MKKKLLMILGLAGAGSLLNAQTITFPAQMPTAGDVISYEIVDVENNFGWCFDPAGAGASVTDKVWDVRTCPTSGTAAATLGQQTITFNDAAATAYTSNYPKANFAISYGGIDAAVGYEYYRYKGDSITRLAFTDASGPQLWYVESHYDATFPRYVFPFNPGESWSSTYHGDFTALGAGEDSVKVNNGNYSASAFARGSLILPATSFGSPGEQFDDVVMVKVTESFDIDMWADLGGATLINAMEVSENYYAWYKDGVQEPIMIYYETTTILSAFLGGGTDVTTVLKYQPLDGIDPTGISEISTYNAFTIYPNPTEGVVNITLRDEDITNAQVKVYNILGEEVLSFNENLTFYNTVDLSDFNAGIYYVKVMNNGREGTQKVILK